MQRNCPNPNSNPNCLGAILYNSEKNMRQAEVKNTLCRSCVSFGRKPWNVGMAYDEMYGDRKFDIIEKARKKLVGRRHTEEYKKWQSKHTTEGYTSGKFKKLYGDENPAKRPEVRKKISEGLAGYRHSSKTKLKLRLMKIKELKSKGWPYPNYNPDSIPIIEAKAGEMEIADLQHAGNGGEFYIEELGYWVDGYSKEKNVVIEYYEKHHKYQKERDKRRKREIIEHLGCEFIEIKGYN